MAKRKRLIPPHSLFETGSDIAQSNTVSGAPEVKAFLRPDLGGRGHAGGGPPIAQVAADSASQAALIEMSQAMASARTEGRLVQALPLSRIEADHLVRDRIAVDEEELGHLIASIRAHGQRSPIEVTELAPGRYGLISGWRRLQALTRLSETEKDPRFLVVLALLRRPDSASDAYIAMVEENEVRQGLSYYERARIAARTVDMGVFNSEKQALQRLFAAASRARRSKIGSFLRLYRTLDPGLRFAAAIPERLGLALAKSLEAAPAAAALLCEDMIARPSANAADEHIRLARFIAGKKVSDTAQSQSETIPDPVRTEPCPGVFLEVTGGWLKPVLTLSGPGVGPDFRGALDAWLAGRGV